MTLSTQKEPLLNKLKLFCRYNKYKIIITIVLITGFLALLMYGVDLTLCADDDEQLHALQRLAMSMVKKICYTDIYTKVAEEATIDIIGGNVGGANIGVITNAMTSVNEFLIGIATAVAVVLWFPQVASTFLAGQAYAELIIKKLAVLGITVFLVANSMTICTYVVQAGSEVTEKIVTTINSTPDTSGSNTAYNQMETYFANINTEPVAVTGAWYERFWANICNFFTVHIITPGLVCLSLLLPLAMLRVAVALTSVFTIIRAVEAIVLIMMSPIPFALVGNEPLGSGAGARFLKNLFALSLQGAVMLIVAYVCQTIYRNVLLTAVDKDTLVDACYNLIAVAIAELGLLSKSLQISQKVFGLQ